MNSDLFSLLVRLHDVERNLVYIIKNSAYKQEAAQAAADHVKDMSAAVETAARVLDAVLCEQMKTI